MSLEPKGNDDKPQSYVEMTFKALGPVLWARSWVPFCRLMITLVVVGIAF